MVRRATPSARDPLIPARDRGERGVLRHVGSNYRNAEGIANGDLERGTGPLQRGAILSAVIEQLRTSIPVRRLVGNRITVGTHAGPENDPGPNGCAICDEWHACGVCYCPPDCHCGAHT